MSRWRQRGPDAVSRTAASPGRRGSTSGSSGRAGAGLPATSIILLVAGAPPFQAYKEIVRGAVGSLSRLLERAGGLGAAAARRAGRAGDLRRRAVEHRRGRPDRARRGAHHLGHCACCRTPASPPRSSSSLAILAGIVGGALWAGLAGVLKTFGGVNEIFGGLGLNFVATALTLWLIFGPWKRPGIGSMSGTEPFPDQLALPDDRRPAPESLVAGTGRSWR